MADRNFPSHEVCNFLRDGVLVCGHFEGTVAGITNGSRFGDGYTVDRTALGRYTVTTDETFRHILAWGAQFCEATPTGIFATADVPTGGAGAQVNVEINIWDSAAALVDPAAGDEIHFWLFLSTNPSDRAAW